jgi:hypothetical protein
MHIHMRLPAGSSNHTTHAYRLLYDLKSHLATGTHEACQCVAALSLSLYSTLSLQLPHLLPSLLPMLLPPRFSPATRAVTALDRAVTTP